MPCLFLVVILLFPRVVLVLMYLFTNIIMRAFPSGFLLPLLGFIFLPITTIAYAMMVANHVAIAGVNLIILIIAVLLDAGSHSGGAGYYRRRW